MIKGKTPEEIRKTFNIKNDFTPSEEEQVRKENEWCEEKWKYFNKFSYLVMCTFAPDFRFSCQEYNKLRIPYRFLNNRFIED